MGEEETRIRATPAGEAAAAAPACLVVVDGAPGALGLRVPLAAEVVVGRDAGCGVRLDDPDVSRRHARVVPEEDGHVLHDLGSTNGTFVNEAEVESRRLAHGDVVRVGGVRLEYRAAGDPGARLHDELRRRATTDALTGLANRGAFEEALAREIARARRAGAALAVVVLDVDHFKRVNDAHGHAAGDAVLREVAARLEAAARAGDLAGRVGGEEFAVALPDADLAAAADVAERVRRRVADAPVAFPGGAVAVTISAGVAALAGGEDAVALVARADARLYEAKRAGRDRVRS